MSLKARLKATMKQCFIRKCDREYDRIYQHALKRRDYSAAIRRLEEEQKENLAEPPEAKCEVLLLHFDWNEAVNVDLLAQAKEDVILLCEKGACLHRKAPDLVQRWFATHDNTEVLYGDEDVRDEKGNRSNPWLKPSWSPTLFLKVHYMGALVAVRRNLLLSVLEQYNAVDTRKPDARELIGHICAAAGGFEKRQIGSETDTIAHMDAVLCHHPSNESYGKFLHCKALDGLRIQDEAEKCVSPEKENGQKPIVSIVIPSKDHPEILKQNLHSLKSTVPGIVTGNVEVLIIDNGSTAENKEKIEKLKEELTIPFRYIYKSMDFNFSAMCNIGVKESRGKLLLFLNDDVEAKSAGWLEHMVESALCTRNGCVGVKLLYPGSDQIQHAGIVNLPMGPVHKLQFLRDCEVQYFERNRQDLETIAVTGACLMIRRDVFEEVGGFAEDLPVAFNDVDLCYKTIEKGYYNVCLNSVWLCHHESLSRGSDESAEKLQRLMEEKNKLDERHGWLAGTDPYYHSLLNRRKLDTCVSPAPEEMLYPEREEAEVQTWSEGSCKDLRQHDGVVCRIECQDEDELQGYLFMIGDDNACYAKMLLLEKMGSGEKYWCKLNTCLREDLKRNMPDQRNVALSGFYVKLRGIPKGRYEIAGLAHNKISGVTYMNKTARILSLTEG